MAERIIWKTIKEMELSNPSIKESKTWEGLKETILSLETLIDVAIRLEGDAYMDGFLDGTGDPNVEREHSIKEKNKESLLECLRALRDKGAGIQDVASEMIEVFRQMAEGWPNQEATTFATLAQTIDVWKDIEKGKIIHKGYNTCPLCRLFVSKLNPGLDCVFCPIRRKTGEKYCKGTPYAEWVAHSKQKHSSGWVMGQGKNARDVPYKKYPGCKECDQLINKEIEFLEELKNEQLRRKHE